MSRDEVKYYIDHMDANSRKFTVFGIKRFGRTYS